MRPSGSMGFSPDAARTWARGDDIHAARALSMQDFKTGAQNTRFSEALLTCNAEKRRLVIDEPMSVSQQVDIAGFCDIAIVGEGAVTLTGLGANQRAAIRARNYVPAYGANQQGLPTPVASFNAGGIAHELYPAATGRDVSTITVNDASAIVPPCALYFKSAATNEYSESSSGFAEIFWCFAKAGNKLYLHGRFTRLTSAHAGTVYAMADTHCRISGKFSTTQDFLAASAIWVEGYVQPVLDLSFGMASSSGLLLVSNFQPVARAVGRNMRRDTPNNRYGYLIASYGANVGQRCEAHSTNLYHAWTDSMYSSEGMLSGHTKGGGITGSAVGNTGHAFDTHMDSDGVTFHNLTVLGGHSDTYQPNSGNVAALQLRGHNATVNGLTTDLETAIWMKEWHQFDSQTTLNNIRHLDNRFDKSATSAEQMKTIYFDELVVDGNNNPVARTGSYSTKIRGSDIAYVEIKAGYSYPLIEFEGGSVDMRKAYNRAAPGNAGTEIRSVGTVWYGNNSTAVLLGKWRFNGGYWQLASGQLNPPRLDGGTDLEAVNFGVRVFDPATQSINNSSAFRAVGTAGTTRFRYFGIWCNDARAAGTVAAISNAAAGATLDSKSLAVT